MVLNLCTMKACVLGAGAFGTAIATALAVHCREVVVWVREGHVCDHINRQHENHVYLPGVALPLNIVATTSLPQALAEAELVVVAIPSQATREVLLSAVPYLPLQVPIVTVAKGIENGTLLTMTEVMEDVLPENFHPYLAALSGPSFAKEMARRLPTVVTIAAKREDVAQKAQKAFSTDTFRAYTSSDVVGVQMGGALKNVIAIAAGLSDGLGFGYNARAALITRGLAEISRAAVRKGANPLTLAGLSGLGDLVLTCTGELSRNRTLGLELAQGKTLKEVLLHQNQVVEGVKTAQSAKDLAAQLAIEMPICEQVYAILYEGKVPKVAVYELMTRQPKHELA